MVAIAMGLGGCATQEARGDQAPADSVFERTEALTVASGTATGPRGASPAGVAAVQAIPTVGGVGMWNGDVEQTAPACTIIKLVNIPFGCYGAGDKLQLNLKLQSSTGALVSRSELLSSATPNIVLYNTRGSVVQEVALNFPDDAPAAICGDHLSISSAPGAVTGFPVIFGTGGVTRFNAGAPWGGTGGPTNSSGQPITAADIANGNHPCRSNVSFRVEGVASPIPSSGLHLWLQADAGIVPAAGAQISRWLDQSGNGRNASMTTVARQPSLIANALNGRPVVRFFGAQSLSFDVRATPTRFSIFVVGKNSSPSESFSMILGPAGDAPNNQLRWETGSQALFVAQNSATIITSTIGNTRVYHALSARYDGSLINFFRDGNATSSSAFTTTTPWTTASLGSFHSSDFMIGDLAEVILYDRALSETERASVNAYLRLKYNLP